MFNMKDDYNKKVKAQGLVEYILVFVCATILVYAFVAQIDLKKIKSFAVYGIQKRGEAGKITIPPMTK